MIVTFSIPDCAWCGESLRNGEECVQAFGDEGNYYFHPNCYDEAEAARNIATREDPHWPEYQA